VHQLTHADGVCVLLACGRCELAGLALESQLRLCRLS